jgi:hypothetical protein
MGVPTSEVGYTSATAGRGDHEVHKGHVVALGGGGGIIYTEYKELSFALVQASSRTGVVIGHDAAHSQIRLQKAATVQLSRRAP